MEIFSWLTFKKSQAWKKLLQKMTTSKAFLFLFWHSGGLQILQIFQVSSIFIGMHRTVGPILHKVRYQTPSQTILSAHRLIRLVNSLIYDIIMNFSSPLLDQLFAIKTFIRAFRVYTI